MNELMHRCRRIFDGIAMTPSVIAVYGASSLIAGWISLSASGLDAAQVFLISAGVTAGAMGLLLLASRFLRRFRVDPVVPRYGMFALSAAIVGAIRGLTLSGWTAAWGALEQSGVMTQIVNSSFSAVLWMTVAGLLFAGRERYRRQYRSLLIQGAISGGASQAAGLDLDTHPNVVQVRRKLTDALATPNLDPSPEDLNRVAEAIRHEIEFNIRPLSHRLWFSAGAEEPHVRLSRLMRDALGQFTVPITAVSVVWFIGAIVGGLRLFGMERATLSAIVSTSVLVIFLWVGRRLVARYTRVGALWMLVSAITPVFVADAVSRALGFASVLSGDPALTVLLPTALFALITAGSMISLAHADRDVVIQVATRRSGVPPHEFVGPRQVSSFLHNSLQSEMTGLAMQLESSAAHGDAEQSREALVRLQSLLERSLMGDLKAMNCDVDGRIASIIDGWSGICEVSFSVAEQVRDDPRMPVAVLAAEELVANSVRHSGATLVEVSITAADRGISVIARANHSVPNEIVTGAPGIGAQVLRTLAHRKVHMSAEGEWTRFSLVVT